LHILSLQLARNLLLQAVILTSLVLFSPAAFSQNVTDVQDDTQLWPDVSVTVRLRDKLRLNMLATVREGRDVSDVVNKQFGIGLGITLNKYLSVAQMYRYVRSQPLPGTDQREHRWVTDLTLRIPLRGGFLLTDRHRHDWRDISGNWSHRYRNRVQLERSISLHDHRLTPYISAEPYYDTRFHTWTRTQYFFGARVPVIRHLTFDGFYMCQLDDRARPGNLHVIGTFLRLDF
jgi:hypothetical protein